MLVYFGIQGIESTRLYATEGFKGYGTERFMGYGTEEFKGGISIIGPHYSERQKHLLKRPKTKVLVRMREQYRKVPLSYISGDNSYSYDNSS